MTPDNHPGKETSSGNKGEVRPSTNKNDKLEDKITDEKDNKLSDESASDERKRDS
jgi:hypothetical protein